MDKEALEENSSSQKDNFTVSNIFARGAGEEAFIISFLSGSSFFIMPELLHLKKIKKGTVVNNDTYCEIVLQDEQLRAYLKALDLLSIRDHSSFEIRNKLLKRKFTRYSIDRVIEKIEEKGFLNDDSFAKKWLDSRLRKKNEGPFLMISYLMKKGVNRRTAERVVSNYFTENKELELLEKAVSKIMKKKSLDKAKFLRQLCQKGFSPSLINSYIRKNTLFAG